MARKKKTLLIVDDEVNVTRTLQMVFEDEGYSVTPAYSCAEALKIMKNGHQFDGVITDLNMEREDIGLAIYAVFYRSFYILIIDVTKLFATLEELVGLDMSWGKLARKGRI